jgi:hypothetical protein
MLAALCCIFQTLFSQEQGYGAFSELFRTPDFGAAALADNGGGPKTAEALDAAGRMPQWVRDLRRAEIIAFGTLPFTIFFSSFFMDLYRSGSHGWDARYMPWPFKSPGAIAMTGDELRTMFTIAISSSVILAVADHFIMRYKRAKLSGGNPDTESGLRPAEPGGSIPGGGLPPLDSPAEYRELGINPRRE